MLATLLASLASGEAVQAAQRIRRATIAYAIAALLSLAAAGFLVGAGYMWTAEQFGAIEAALMFAGGFLVLALLVLAINKAVTVTREHALKRRRKSELVTVGTAAALAVLPSLIRGRGGLLPLLAAPAALAAFLIYQENTRRSENREDEGR